MYRFDNVYIIKMREFWAVFWTHQLSHIVGIVCHTLWVYCFRFDYIFREKDQASGLIRKEHIFEAKDDTYEGI